MKMICELDCDRYTSCEDNLLLQVSVVSCVGVANPFHVHWQYQLEDYKYQLCKVR